MNAEILLIIMLSLIVFNFYFQPYLNYINDKNWKEFYSRKHERILFQKKHIKKQKTMPRKKGK